MIKNLQEYIHNLATQKDEDKALYTKAQPFRIRDVELKQKDNEVALISKKMT